MLSPYFFILCDKCGSALAVVAEWMYKDYSGENWYWEIEKPIEKECEKEDWEVVDTDTHYCPNCKDEEEED
jgi:hypothetical protein